MKRTIIIAASAVTLAAAGIAGSQYLSGQSPSAQLQVETASEIRQEKSEDSGRKKKTAAVLQRRQLPTALLPLRYR